MPTNAEIKAAIDLIIRQPHNHILTGAVADILDDIVDNITGGPGGTPGIDSVLAEGQVITANRAIDATGFDLTSTANSHTFNIPVSGIFSVIGDGNNQMNYIPRGGFSSNISDVTGDIKSNFVFEIDATSSTFELQLYFDDNKAAYIRGHAETGLSTLEGWADEHEWYVGNNKVFEIDIDGVKILSLAGGGTTGLSIDNDGKIIRTP